MSELDDPLRTPMGTVIRDSWTQEYHAHVILKERMLSHAICGAVTSDGTPCGNRPKKRYGWVCGNHRDKSIPLDSEIDKSIKDNKQNIEDRKDLRSGMFDITYIKAMFAQCNTCKIKQTCTSMIEDQRCSIEEGAFFNFIDSIMKEHPDFETTDMPVLFQAGLAFVSSLRNRIIQAMSNPNDDYYAQFQLMSLRETMEYRKAVKMLGLGRFQKTTPRQVKSLEDGEERTDAIRSIADLMSLPAGKDLEIEHKTIIRRKIEVEPEYDDSEEAD